MIFKFHKKMLSQRSALTVETISDQEIIKKVLGNEEHLFELLMRRYNQRLFRLARSVIKSDAEAEDIVQEAYVKAYINLKRFKSSFSAGAWLAKITINEALGRLRKYSRLHSLDTSSLDEDILQNEIIEQHKLNMNPEYTANTQEVSLLIKSAIDNLPKDYRMVFVLRAVEQLSVNETATYLEIKTATVKTRYHRAKLLLQHKLNTQIEAAAIQAYSFAGKQCDHIVKSVLDRISKLIY